MNSSKDEYLGWRESLNRISEEVHGAKVGEITDSGKQQRKPILVIDFHHDLEGEVVPIPGIKEILGKEEGVYKIMLFNSDPLETHIPDITGRLLENKEELRRWMIVFTNTKEYIELDEFREFIKHSDSMGSLILD